MAIKKINMVKKEIQMMEKCMLYKVSIACCPRSPLPEALLYNNQLRYICTQACLCKRVALGFFSLQNGSLYTSSDFLCVLIHSTVSIKIYMKDIIISHYYILKCTMGNYSSFSRSPSPKKSWKCHLCLHTDVEEQQTKGENEPVVLHCQLSPPWQTVISSQGGYEPI